MRSGDIPNARLTFHTIFAFFAATKSFVFPIPCGFKCDF